MVKKTASKVEPGDRLLVELPVVATWPDMGKITVTIAGTRFTFAGDNPEIRDVLKKAKERAEHGQAKIGSSAFAKAFDEGRGWSRK